MKMLKRGCISELRGGRLHQSNKRFARRVTDQVNVKASRNIGITVGHGLSDARSLAIVAVARRPVALPFMTSDSSCV